MENLMKLWQVRERNFHKLGQQKAYWQVSIMHQKVGIQTIRFGRSKNAPPFYITQNIRYSPFENRRSFHLILAGWKLQA